MNELELAKAELDSLYKATVEPNLPLLEYLRRCMTYVGFLKTNVVLSRLISSYQEGKAYERIIDMRKSMADPVYRKLTEMRDMAPDFDEGDPVPPLYALRELEEAHEDFTILGDAKTEEEFKEKKIQRRLETKDGTGWITETSAGNTLLAYASYEYPKMLMIFHKQMLSEINKVLAVGHFPTYLDYQDGTLYVQGKPVRIMNRKTPNNAHYLLQYLFANNPTEQHFYGELEEDKVLLEESSWQAYYRAATDIQKKVEFTTGIPDFLDFSSGKSLYVRIHPKHSLISESSG
jgi:hypothetical protein